MLTGCYGVAATLVSLSGCHGVAGAPNHSSGVAKVLEVVFQVVAKVLLGCC